jgi:hypothetical protein
MHVPDSFNETGIFLWKKYSPPLIDTYNSFVNPRFSGIHLLMAMRLLKACQDIKDN